MPVTYSEAPSKYHDDLTAVMVKYHGELSDADVKVTILLASGPRDQDGSVYAPAIKVRGHRVSAQIKVTNLKDRAAGLGDAVLILDGDECESWDEEAYEAVLDQQLTRLELRVDHKGKVVRDDLDRPKLRMRQYEFEIAGFHSVAQKHKQAAPEVAAVAKVGGEMVRQGSLPGF